MQPPPPPGDDERHLFKDAADFWRLMTGPEVQLTPEETGVVQGRLDEGATEKDEEEEEDEREGQKGRETRKRLCRLGTHSLSLSLSLALSLCVSVSVCISLSCSSKQYSLSSRQNDRKRVEAIARLSILALVIGVH